MSDDTVRQRPRPLVGRPGRRTRVGEGSDLSGQRNFRLLWFGETVSMCGSATTTVALPLVAVSVLHAEAFTVGALAAATWLPFLLVGLPAGAWVDRFPRRVVMVAGDLISAALFVSVPVAAWLHVLGVGQLLVVAFGAGLVRVFFRTAYQAYLPTVVEPHLLPQANARLQGSASAAEVAGPGIAGVIAQATGAVTAVLADGVSFLVSAACLLRIDVKERPIADPRQTTGLIRRIGEGLRFVVGDRYLRTLAAFGALSNMLLVAVQALLVIFLIRDVGVASGTAGLLIAGLGIGGVAGAAVSSRLLRRFGTARTMVWSQLVSAPFALLLPLTDRGWRLAFFLLGTVVLAAGVVISSIISSSFRQSYCPNHILGRVSSVVSFLVFGVMPLGALIGGALGATLGVRTALWILTGLLVAPVLLLIFSPISHGRDLPTGPAPDPDLAKTA